MTRAAVPLQSSLPAFDHESLFAVFTELFETATESMQWDKADRPRLVEEYPQERAGKGYDQSFDVILMSLAGSQPARQSNSGARDAGYRNFNEGPVPGKAGYARIRSQWSEEAVVQFEVLAKSNRRANQLANWWHRTLMVYANSFQFLRARGCNHFRYLQRLPDEAVKEYGQELKKRTLQYVLRLELVSLAEAKTMESFTISVGVDGPEPR